MFGHPYVISGLSVLSVRFTLIVISVVVSVFLSFFLCFFPSFFLSFFLPFSVSVLLSFLLFAPFLSLPSTLRAAYWRPTSGLLGPSSGLGTCPALLRRK